MSETYYKAVREDGASFHDRTTRWVVGEVTSHNDAGAMRPGDASTYLSVAVVPTDCTGMDWPCRLFRVEPVGEVITPTPGLPNKRAAKAWQVVEELDATQAFGPQGAQLVALIERAGRLTAGECDQLAAARGAAGGAAWGAAGGAAWDAAGDAARGAAWDAAGGAARGAARDAALALLTRDLISQEDYDTLSRPWRTVIGRIHADDAAVLA